MVKDKFLKDIESKLDSDDVMEFNDLLDDVLVLYKSKIYLNPNFDISNYNINKTSVKQAIIEVLGHYEESPEISESQFLEMYKDYKAEVLSIMEGIKKFSDRINRRYPSNSKVKQFGQKAASLAGTALSIAGTALTKMSSLFGYWVPCSNIVSGLGTMAGSKIKTLGDFIKQRNTSLEDYRTRAIKPTK